MAFPTLDPTTGKVEDGVWCTGCTEAYKVWNLPASTRPTSHPFDTSRANYS